VAHVEIEPATVQKKTAIAWRLFIVAVVQIDRADLRFAEEMIFHPYWPGIGSALHIAPAHEAAIFRFESDDAIH
jgi:hypothetical protein